MKNFTLLLACLFIGFSSLSQVGINTTEPTSTLDVNGNIRVRNIEGGSENEIIATQVVGLDEEGNFVRIEVSDNIYLENNELRIVERKADVGQIPVFTGTRANNVSLIIWPGGANSSKSVIRIEHSTGDLEITGFDVSGFGGPAAADGVTVSLYPTDGRLKLLINNTDSAEENRIQNTNGVVVIQQYEMMRIMYDGTLQRWVIMSH